MFNSKKTLLLILVFAIVTSLLFPLSSATAQFKLPSWGQIEDAAKSLFNKGTSAAGNTLLSIPTSILNVVSNLAMSGAIWFSNWIIKDPIGSGLSYTSPQQDKNIYIHIGWTLLRDLTNMLFILGLAYIGSTLREDGFDVKVVDLANKGPIDYPKLRQTVIHEDPLMVGVYGLTTDRVHLDYASMVFKKDNPDRVVVGGGNHLGLIANEIVDTSFDGLCLREGEHPMLGLAQALMENPELIILDEPTNALDESGINLIHELLIKEKNKNKLILIASHNKEDLNVLCDTIYHMESGEIKGEISL